MRLPNGYGSIYKNGSNRRKPYRVSVTTGWDENGKQIRKILGYVASQKEGLKLLAEYHNNPFDLNYKNLTFSDVWQNVRDKIVKLVNEGKMSESNLRGLDNAYNNHCIPIHKDKLIELKYKKMQDLIDSTSLGRTAKGNIKTVCVKIFNCGIDEYELPINNNPAIRLNVGEREESNKHIPFSEEELNILWNKNNNDIIKTVLIFCYTGMRPNELFNIPHTEIYLEENYMRGGSKTKAGKNRVIPIHPRIKTLIEYFIKTDKEYPFKTIIDKFNYGKYERRFRQIMQELNFEHTPYDGRHTFATRMKQAGADEYITKRIMGHSIQDITEKVYTHRHIEELINEVKKIN